MYIHICTCIETFLASLFRNTDPDLLFINHIGCDQADAPAIMPF